MIWLLLHGCFQWESSDNRHTTSAVQTLGMEGWGGVGRGVVGGNNTEKAFTYIHYVLEGWGSPNLLLLHVRLILSSSLISNLATNKREASLSREGTNSPLRFSSLLLWNFSRQVLSWHSAVLSENRCLLSAVFFCVKCDSLFMKLEAGSICGHRNWFIESSILAPSQWPGVLFLSRKQGNNRVCHKQRWYIAFNLTCGPTRKEEEYTPLKKMLTTVISSYLILQYLESVQTSKRCQSHSFSLLLSKL